MSQPHIEIILPVYNERENLPLLIRHLDAAKKEVESDAKVTYLFIDDGSLDGSNEILRRWHEERSDVRVIELLHNFGHSAALACGIDHFRADAAIVMDADMQDPPGALKEMFEAWRNGAKTVVIERGKRPEKRGYLFRTFYFLLRKTARNLPPIDFGTHSLLDATVVARLRLLKERNRYFPGLVGFSSAEITPLKYDRGQRAHGESRVGMWGLINLALTAFLSFSNAPIRVVSVMGLICSAGALIGATTIVGIKLLTDRAIPGWASTMSLMFFSSGIQLLCLGILGEYVARIYDEVKQRPLYLVAEELPLARDRAKSKAA